MSPDNKIFLIFETPVAREDEGVMHKYLFETVEWRRALATKFGERDLS